MNRFERALVTTLVGAALWAAAPGAPGVLAGFEMADRPGANRDRLRDRRRRLPANGRSVRSRSTAGSPSTSTGRRRAASPSTCSSGSVDVGSASFGDYLRSPAFLDAEMHPSIDFVSSSVEKVSDRAVRVSGELTLLGVTKPLTVDVAVDRPPDGEGRLTFLAQDADRSAGLRDELRLPAGFARRRPDHPQRGGASLTASPPRWSPAVVALHWINAALILGLDRARLGR